MPMVLYLHANTRKDTVQKCLTTTPEKRFGAVAMAAALNPKLSARVDVMDSIIVKYQVKDVLTSIFTRGTEWTKMLMANVGIANEVNAK